MSKNNNNKLDINNNDNKLINTKKNKTKEKLQAGRKSKYESHVKPKLHLITQWCKNGSTEEQIYKKLGVSHEAFARYKRAYVELVEALKIGKDDADDLVESALFKRALGYEYEETEESESYNPETGQTVKTRKIIKHLVADTTAQIFWLKNRRPDRWRNNDRLDINTTSTQVEDSAIESTLSILKAREVEKKEKDDLLGEENE